MVDLTLPAGALDRDLEAHLVARLTETLLELQGIDPTDPVHLGLSWTYVHRPESVYVAGMAERAPHFRVEVTTPVGQLDDDDREAMTLAITEIVMEIESEVRDPDARRIWVLFHEVADGRWGAVGRVFRTADLEAIGAGRPTRLRPLAA